MAQFFKEYKTISYVVCLFPTECILSLLSWMTQKATGRKLIWAYKMSQKWANEPAQWHTGVEGMVIVSPSYDSTCM